jgi:hypothetical protein
MDICWQPVGMAMMASHGSQLMGSGRAAGEAGTQNGPLAAKSSQVSQPSQSGQGCAMTPPLPVLELELLELLTPSPVEVLDDDVVAPPAPPLEVAAVTGSSPQAHATAGAARSIIHQRRAVAVRIPPV